MPVRSLNSAVLRWPDSKVVLRAAREWAEVVGGADDTVVKIGCFGSCVVGDWGVGSDLDLIVIVESTDLPFERRGTKISTSQLPVPCDVLVYTQNEWARLLEEEVPFSTKVDREAVWLYGL